MPNGHDSEADVEQQAKWDAFSWEKKCVLIARFVEKGMMI